METLHFVYLSPVEDVLTDEEWRAVEQRLMRNPRLGDVIQGGGGLRKMRAALGGRGQRCGARIVYLFIEPRSQVYFVFAYVKNLQEDLTPEQRAEARELTRYLKGEV